MIKLGLLTSWFLGVNDDEIEVLPNHFFEVIKIESHVATDDDTMR